MINEPSTGKQRFTKKVWVVTSIVALTVIVIWILKAIFNVLLLVLAGALIALYFQGLSKLIHRKLHLKEKWSLPVAIIITLLVLAVFFVFAGAKINQQVSELSQTLPSTVEKIKQELNKSAIGQQILQKVSSPESREKMTSIAGSFFRSSFGVLGDVYIVLFLGIFFTVSPKIYVNGLLSLIPSGAKPKAKDITNKLALKLTKWLKGKLLAMLVVAILTLTGLLIIGVPMAFVLSLIAGILNFIPNFGPLIALIPAILIGFMQSPVTALLVAGLYILVQVLESNFITPQIQKRLVQVPPALIIIAQLFMGVLTGGWGLVLATPLLVILMTVVKELYINKMPENE